MKLLERIKNKFKGGSGSLEYSLMGGAFMLLVVGLVLAFLWAVDWGAKNQPQRPWGYEYREDKLFNKIYKRAWYKPREPKQVLSPLAQEVVEDIPSELSELELLIRSMWGEENFVVARAIAICESNMNPLAINWSSKDFGLFQINLPIWEDLVLQEFGYTRADLLDPYKNTAVACWIWDRADGEVGNGEGSWEPWVAAGNECFVREL